MHYSMVKQVITTKFSGVRIFKIFTVMIETQILHSKIGPPRDKTNKMSVRPAKTQISLGIHPAWSES